MDGDPVGTSVGFRGDMLGLEVGCEKDDANKIETRKVSVCEMTAVRIRYPQIKRWSPYYRHKRSCLPPLLAMH